MVAHRRGADGDRPFPDGVRGAAVRVALLCLILGIGAFKPNVSTQVGVALRAGRHAAAARLFDLLRRHQYRGVPGAAGRRHARRRGRLALRLRRRRHRHAGQPRDLSRRHAPPAAGRARTRPKAAGGAVRSPASGARSSALIGRVRDRHLLLGDLRPAGQHAAVVDRGSHRALGRPRLLARRDPDHLVPGAQPADDLRVHADPAPAVGLAGTPRHRAADHREAVARLRAASRSPMS